MKTNRKLEKCFVWQLEILSFHSEWSWLNQHWRQRITEQLFHKQCTLIFYPYVTIKLIYWAWLLKREVGFTYLILINTNRALIHEQWIIKMLTVNLRWNERRILLPNLIINSTNKCTNWSIWTRLISQC